MALGLCLCLLKTREQVVLLGALVCPERPLAEGSLPRGAKRQVTARLNLEPSRPEGCGATRSVPFSRTSVGGTAAGLPCGLCCSATGSWGPEMLGPACDFPPHALPGGDSSGPAHSLGMTQMCSWVHLCFSLSMCGESLAGTRVLLEELMVPRGFSLLTQRSLAQSPGPRAAAHVRWHPRVQLFAVQPSIRLCEPVGALLNPELATVQAFGGVGPWPGRTVCLGVHWELRWVIQG